MHLQSNAMLAGPEQAARSVRQAHFEQAAGNLLEQRENQARSGRRTVAAAQNHRIVHFEVS
jgi:ATP sulfurylase